MSRYFQLVIVGLLLVVGQVQAAETAKGIDAAVAEQCRVIGKCAYFTDVYNGTPKFRDAIRAAFSSANLAPPRWVKNGTNSPMIPILLDGTTYLFGSVCEPHNCPHVLVVLYSGATGSMVALYDDGNSNRTYLGRPSPKQQQFFSEYLDSSTLARTFDEPKSLPVVVD